MLSPWFLLSLLFTIARTFAVSRNSFDLPKNPSCQQLRAFWDEINQTAGDQPMTNEIPVMSTQVDSAMDRLATATAGRNSKPNRKLLKIASSNFNAIKNNFPKENPPASPNFKFFPGLSTSTNDVNGVFGKFHEQYDEQSTKQNRLTEPKIYSFRSPSAVPLGNKKNERETEFYMPQWGLPDEVDTFGSFVDFDIGTRPLAMARTPKGVKGKWSDALHQVTSQEKLPQMCNALINSDCTENGECICSGWRTLTCVRGKCLNDDQNNDMGRKYGTWHNGPIPVSQLQLLSRLKKTSYN